MIYFIQSFWGLCIQITNFDQKLKSTFQTKNLHTINRHLTTTIFRRFTTVLLGALYIMPFIFLFLLNESWSVYDPIFIR
jgi:hypothetical protein